MQKFRKNPCTDFLQNLKNLILGPIWPKNFKNGFPQKNHFVQF